MELLGDLRFVFGVYPSDICACILRGNCEIIKVRHSDMFFGIVMVGIFYFSVEIILQMMTTKRVNGRKVNSIK